ncbi:MAG: DUF1800 family protein [Acidimicrobiales bacterium]
MADDGSSSALLTTAQAALLVRRTAFGLKLNRVSSFTGLTRAAAVSRVLAETAANSANQPDDWVGGFQNATSGIGDRMTMFWHNLIPISRIDLTSNYSNKIPGNLAILKRNAVGNYRTLMHEIITDDGLILYLNGNLNVKGSPNENLARELMELFTIGPGHYSQRDVEQAALAMTGWGGSGLHNNNKAHVGSITIFGQTRNSGQGNNQWNVHTLVDALLDRQETADRISKKIWHYFVGGEGDPRFNPPSDLGSRWRTTDGYELQPLLERILLSSQFWSRDYSRARNGLEIFAALASVTGIQASKNRSLMRNLGMLPYEPPNVAGWPTQDSVWLSYGTDLRIAKSLFELNIQSSDTSVDQTLAKCGIFVADQQNKATIASGANPQERLRLALISPEFRMQ